MIDNGIDFVKWFYSFGWRRRRAGRDRKPSRNGYTSDYLDSGKNMLCSIVFNQAWNNFLRPKARFILCLDFCIAILSWLVYLLFDRSSIHVVYATKNRIRQIRNCTMPAPRTSMNSVFLCYQEWQIWFSWHSQRVSEKVGTSYFDHFQIKP